MHSSWVAILSKRMTLIQVETIIYNKFPINSPDTRVTLQKWAMPKQDWNSCWLSHEHLPTLWGYNHNESLSVGWNSSFRVTSLNWWMGASDQYGLPPSRLHLCFFFETFVPGSKSWNKYWWYKTLWKDGNVRSNLYTQNNKVLALAI